MTPADRAGRRTFVESDRALARLLARPVQRFLHVEAAGGVVLLLATLVALLWANSPWKAGYASLFHTSLTIQLGSHSISEDLTHWINDGLMALFFFVVGLEIKREWVAGELRDRRAAVLPAVAALGGMVVPALLYLAINAGGTAGRGWGVPIATDIAFALGVVAVLGRRVPAPLKVFLLTLAIVDDIGAILVIAFFYSSQISFGWLGGALLIVLAVVALRRARVVHPVVFVVLGGGLWLCVFESGVHATIAGVVMGLLTPALPFQPELESAAVVDTLEGRDDLSADDVRRVSFLIRTSVPLTERLEALLHPWTSYVVIPLFALANAGIELTGDSLSGGGRVLVGVLVALVVGKAAGIAGASWLAVRLGWGRLPVGARWSQLVGIAALGGIGFTVSLFVAGLAFPPGDVQADAKVGVLAASVLSAGIGSAILVRAARAPRPY